MKYLFVQDAWINSKNWFAPCRLEATQALLIKCPEFAYDLARMEDPQEFEEGEGSDDQEHDLPESWYNVYRP